MRLEATRLKTVEPTFFAILRGAIAQVFEGKQDDKTDQLLENPLNQIYRYLLNQTKELDLVQLADDQIRELRINSLVEIGKYGLFQAQLADFRVYGMQAVLELINISSVRAIYEGVRSRLMVVREVK